MPSAEHPPDNKDIWRDYQLLDMIARDENASQRDLSRGAGIALGRTNQVIKRLIRKGLVKTRQVNAKRVAYYLTPKGFSEKLRLVMEYTQNTISLFSCVREIVSRGLQELMTEKGVHNVAIVGKGELAEAALLSIQEAGLHLAAVYDAEAAGSTWFGRPVLPPGQKPDMGVESVIVADMRDPDPEREGWLKEAGAVIDLRHLLSERLASFARRIAEDGS